WVIRATSQQSRTNSSGSSAKASNQASRKPGPAMTSILALLASRVRLIGTSVCLLFLSSCITIPGWFAETSQRPILPAEASFTKVNGAAGRGGNLFLTLRFESGEELLFLVDTGTPFTVLDKSLDRKLGRRVGTAEVFYAYYERRVHQGVHKAPKL